MGPAAFGPEARVLKRIVGIGFAPFILQPLSGIAGGAQLILVLPRFVGFDGVAAPNPISDVVAAAAVFLASEGRRLASIEGEPLDPSRLRSAP